MKQSHFLFGGILFGFGLALSGMTKPEIILDFLQLKDMGLLLVLGGAVTVTALAYWRFPKLFPRSISGVSFSKKKKPHHKHLISGAIFFGVGWGLSGMCPGSAIASIGIGNYPILIGIAGMFIGSFIHGVQKN